MKQELCGKEGKEMNETLAENFETGEETMKGRYLTFQVGKETFGIEIKYVIEIVGLQSLTQMPEMPEYIKGIMNLRGKVIPAMDVRQRFKLPAREYDDRTCIIVIDFGGMSVGLIIDSVSDVLSISGDQIMEKPEISGRGGCGYVNSVGMVDDQVIMLIDCEKLLNRDEYADISSHLA